MDQFIVTIEPGADVALLRKIIKNIKGFGKVVLKKDVKTKPKMTRIKKTEANTEEWINKMRVLSNMVDTSTIDMNDERTRYIMSK